MEKFVFRVEIAKRWRDSRECEISIVSGIGHNATRLQRNILAVVSSSSRGSSTRNICFHHLGENTRHFFIAYPLNLGLGNSRFSGLADGRKFVDTLHGFLRNNGWEGGGVLFKQVKKLCCWQSWCVLGIFVLYIRREKNERWNWWIVFVFLTSWERRMNVRSLKRQSGFGLYIEIGILFLISWERGIGIGFFK